MNINLIKKRLEKDLTQKEAAKAVGITAAALSNYENGIRKLRPIVASKLAALYGCSVEELTVSEKLTPFDFAQLKKAAMPLIKYLQENGHPHMTAIVTSRNIVLTEDVAGMPIEYED